MPVALVNNQNYYPTEEDTPIVHLENKRLLIKNKVKIERVIQEKVIRDKDLKESLFANIFVQTAITICLEIVKQCIYSVC